jgi:4-amino-4-deoxy-L-arabinose transferase-like glycosyltransferase
MGAFFRVIHIRPFHHTPGIGLDWTHVPPALLGLTAAVALFSRLGYPRLVDWDEAIYAQVAREMVNSGNWLTPHLNGQLWFEKPPLLFWITATLFKLFSVNELWARATSALAGVLLVVLAYYVGTKLYNRWVGILTAVTLLTNYHFLQQARRGMTDTLLTFLIWLGVYGYLRVRTGGLRWWHVIWAAFALAFMVKAWAALAAPAVIGLTLLLDRKWGAVRSKHFLLGLVLAVMIVAPWHLYMLATYGRAFFERYVMVDLVARTNTAVTGLVFGPQFYLVRLQDWYSPWALLIPFAVALGIKEVSQGHTRPRILIILVSLMFGVYSSLIQTKVDWYILPIYPALAMLTGSLLFEAFKSPRSVAFGGLVYAAFAASLFVSARFIAIFLVVIGVVALCLVGGILVIRGLTRWSSIPASDPLDVPVASARRSALIRSWCGRLAASWGVSALCLLLVLLGARKARPLYQRGEEGVATIAKMAGGAPYQSRGPLLALALGGDSDDGVQGPTALFYSNRPITVAWSLEELATHTSQDEARDILLSQSYVKRLAAEYDVYVFTQVESYVYATIRRKGNP